MSSDKVEKLDAQIQDGLHKLAEKKKMDKQMDDLLGIQREHMRNKVRILQKEVWRQIDRTEVMQLEINRLKEQQDATVLARLHRKEMQELHKDVVLTRIRFDDLYKKSNEIAHQYDIAKKNLSDYIKAFEEEIRGNKQIRRLLCGDGDEDEDGSSYSETMIPFIEKIAEELATLREENKQMKAVVQATAEEL